MKATVIQTTGPEPSRLSNLRSSALFSGRNARANMSPSRYTSTPLASEFINTWLPRRYRASAMPSRMVSPAMAPSSIA